MFGMGLLALRNTWEVDKIFRYCEYRNVEVPGTWYVGFVTIGVGNIAVLGFVTALVVGVELTPVMRLTGGTPNGDGDLFCALPGVLVLAQVSTREVLDRILR